MADCYEPIFDPVIYKAMRLVYEDNPSSSKELKDMVLNAIQNRSVAPSPVEDTSVTSGGSSRPSSSKGIAPEPARATCPKEEAIEVKEDPYEFDEIPTSSISIGRKSAQSVAPFSDGCCVCGKSKNDSPGNKLFECTECHRNYHQNCHSPPIRDKVDCKVNDPRFVFYCCDCAPVAAPETTYNTNRPAATNRAASSTNLTAGWTVNRPNSGANSAQQQPQPIFVPVMLKEAAPIKPGKRRLPSEDD